MSLPHPLRPAEKETVHGYGADSLDMELLVSPRGNQAEIPKHTRWTVLLINKQPGADPDAVPQGALPDTGALCDSLWQRIGADETKRSKRFMSVARHCGTMWVLLGKYDHGSIDVSCPSSGSGTIFSVWIPSDPSEMSGMRLSGIDHEEP